VARRLDYDADCSLLVRTDFADDAAWEALVADATRPYGPDGFSAYFSAVSDRARRCRRRRRRLPRLLVTA
jgi:hypothetical protein